MCDAGDAPGSEPHGVVRFECVECGHQTGWFRSRGVELEKKGRVCPRCQGDPERAAAAPPPDRGDA
ncbi:hypothetical protein HL658_31260 [Azospirillum sp. RWY-5-1]|uniref:Zinc ribbon domain-containing protein n=1 Tax=Azospirillum oleiclasticum TaxID=2735135 RepID=A0ABX2TJI6_9PROT|nr:hypothetical protein [Azospirillum oleiclasticum]NYZ17044.1 hypothetical protein [Azospirillum oleiclasticum]NYZ24512.1 hypothetical protein [Azospirillum oleiclasticum]